MRLHFVGIGPRRTGTTSMHAYLRTVRGVFLPSPKELHYFDRHFDRGESWYLSHFRLPDPLPDPAWIGEICPSYFNSPTAAERIRRVAPKCRVIATLRHPYERLVSNYNLSLRWTGTPNVALGAAIEQSPSIFEHSRYATHLKPWVERFGPDRLTILFYDDLEADPKGYARRLGESIGIPTTLLPQDLTEHRGATSYLPGRPYLEMLYRNALQRVRRRGHFSVARAFQARPIKQLFVRPLPLPEEPPEIPGWAKDVIREEVKGLSALGITTPDWDLS